MTIDRMIELLEIEHECMLRKSHDGCVGDCGECDLEQDDGELHEMYTDVIAMLRARVPMPAKHIHEEYPEHDWYRDENGDIDMFVLDAGIHNGPGCKRCHESFCEHCEKDWRSKGPCVTDEYRCPVCGGYLVEGRKYCDKCGQAVKWAEAD